jgi:hypothetical protein
MDCTKTITRTKTTANTESKHLVYSDQHLFISLALITYSDRILQDARFSSKVYQ